MVTLALSASSVTAGQRGLFAVAGLVTVWCAIWYFSCRESAGPTRGTAGPGGSEKDIVGVLVLLAAMVVGIMVATSGESSGHRTPPRTTPGTTLTTAHTSPVSNARPRVSNTRPSVSNIRPRTSRPGSPKTRYQDRPTRRAAQPHQEQATAPRQRPLRGRTETKPRVEEEDAEAAVGRANALVVLVVRPAFERLVERGRIGAWGITTIGVPSTALDVLGEQPAPRVIQAITNRLDRAAKCGASMSQPDPRGIIARLAVVMSG